MTNINNISNFTNAAVTTATGTAAAIPIQRSTLAKFPSTKPWLVCLTAALFFYFEFFQINMFNVLDEHLMREFSLGAYQLGIISSAYFYAIVFSLLPAGIVLDFISTRKIILCSMLVAITGTIWFANANSVNQLIYARLFVGLGGGAFCLLSAIKLATRWLPAKQLGLTIGLVISIGMLGGVMSQTPFAVAISYLGWRSAIILDAAIGVLILSFIWLVVQDYPAHATIEERRVPDFNIKAFINNAACAAKRWPNWAAGLFAGLLNLPIFLLGSLIGSLYLTQIYQHNAITSAAINSMLYWGMLLGCPTFGFISDKLASRKRPMLVGSVVTIAALYLLITFSFAPLALAVLFFLIGFGSSSQILAYPMVAERNPKDQIASGEGIAATLIMSGGAIFQPVFGWLVANNWDGTMLHNSPLYALTDYQRAFWLMPIAILVAISILLPLAETKPNH